ncbi:hypothetical protein P3T23_000068 [Paraburkholderia sp. GAS448]|jgi:hypothetical protein|uniref:hypothetical protein n=1 Tax=Paraburkholderia sp. GAS448 TaxID=3035136 RepID=UPI003D1D7980
MDSDQVSSDQMRDPEREGTGHGADLDAPAARSPWLHLWLISSIGVGVGVLGTAMYIMWFSRDMQAYEQAIQAAREGPVALSGTSGWSASAAGQVIHADATMAADPASSAPNAASASGSPTPIFAGAQGEAGTERDASATPVGAEGIRTPSYPAGPAYPASRHRAASPPKPPTLFSRIGSASRRVGFRHHDSGHDQGTYSHP